MLRQPLRVATSNFISNQDVFRVSDKSSSPPPPPPTSTYPTAAAAAAPSFHQETPRTLSASPDQFSPPEWLSGADTRATLVTFGGGRETRIGKLDFCKQPFMQACFVGKS